MNGDPAATDASGQSRSSQHLRRVLKRYRAMIALMTQRLATH